MAEQPDNLSTIQLRLTGILILLVVVCVMLGMILARLD